MIKSLLIEQHDYLYKLKDPFKNIILLGLLKLSCWKYRNVIVI